MIHFILIITLGGFLALGGCKSKFLDVENIPPYDKPSITLAEAKAEISDLKRRKNQQKQKINRFSKS